MCKNVGTQISEPIKASRGSRRGQAMMEYMILVALLAIASIPVVKILGNVLQKTALLSADSMIDGSKAKVKDDRKERVSGGKSKTTRSMSDFYHD